MMELLQPATTSARRTTSARADAGGSDRRRRSGRRADDVMASVCARTPSDFMIESGWGRVAGEEIVILRGKTPVARLTAIAPKPTKRRFGAYRGEFEVPPSFFDPLPEAELEPFEGKDSYLSSRRRRKR